MCSTLILIGFSDREKWAASRPECMGRKRFGRKAPFWSGKRNTSRNFRRGRPTRGKLKGCPILFDFL
jgi:hypothetical protein